MKTATLIRRGTLAFGFALLLPLAAHGQGSPNIIWQGTTNSDRINSISFTPDGSKVVSGSSDRLLVVWDAASGTVLNVMDQSAPDIHPSSIESLSVNPANPVQVATVSSNAEHLWNISTSAKTDLSPEPNTVDDWMVWAAFSQDGKYLATASFNETIRLWTVSGSSATLTKVFTTGDLQRTCAFSPDGKWLASAGGDRSVTVRDTSTWAVVAVMTGHTDDIYDMKFSPDSTMLATGSYDDTARVWNVGAWTAKYVLQGSGPVYGVAFSPDSATLAFTDGEGNHLLLANMASGAITQTYDVNDVQCVAYSPQGTLAYGDVGETVYVANVGAPGAEVVNITSPTAGETVAGPTNITLTATAFSSNGIANVQYFDNGTNLGTATTSPYIVTWNNVAAGTYTIHAVATDRSSNMVNSEPVTFTVGSGGTGSGSGSVTLITNGLGTITPKLPKTLVSGRKYTETANPGPKYVFDGWTDENGNLLSSNATYTFTMSPGLVLQANFVPNPFGSIQGRYTGLIDSSPATAEGKGRINLDLMPNGTFTSSLNFDFASFSVNGKFLGDGYFAKTIPHGKDSSIALTLWLDVSNGTETVTGTISTSAVTSSILANRLVWNSRTNRATAGHYTVTILPDADETNSPQGVGYAHVVIDAAGEVTANGHLADGQAFSETTFLSESNAWPFFVWGGGADIASGFITVENETNSDMDGVVTWFRQAKDHATYYPSGFDSTNELLGSLDPVGNVVLTTGSTDTNGNNATVTISGADFSTPLTFSGVIAHSKLTPDKSTGSPKGFNLTFAANGNMSGTFVDPQSGHPVSFQGIIYQDGNYAEGYFLQDGQSGYIEVAPLP